tara:strand:- start:556 stop:747 length:192 start_codon:yes stop_codon:yes gene_type:complete
MIIKIEYNKSDGTLNLIKDDEMEAVINDNTIIDDDDTLSFEIALNVTKYQQEQLEELNGSINE